MAGEKKEQQDEFAFITEKVMEQLKTSGLRNSIRRFFTCFLR